MKILSWNIMQGGGKRSGEIVAAIRRHGPDVIALTEITAGSVERLVRSLKSDGWGEAFTTDPRGREYGICVLSRTPMRQLASQNEMPCGGLRWLEVELPAHGFTLGVVYILPRAGKERPLKERDWDALLKAAKLRKERPYLFMGDWNTGRHRVDEVGSVVPCSDKFVDLGASGWIDVWRNFHGERREFTWYSRMRGGVLGNGFRLDHAFSSAPLAPRLRGCRYSHAEREAGSSDHSVMLVEVE
ncbi:MAG: endonuclease/exonuclease/phosphatase family protein [Acidobacteria bacterium]|nr:endonuclease/exonuclease/phosphatase family protein [Acidobacteriota bacterium]